MFHRIMALDIIRNPVVQKAVEWINLFPLFSSISGEEEIPPRDFHLQSMDSTIPLLLQPRMRFLKDVTFLGRAWGRWKLEIFRRREESENCPIFPYMKILC